MELGLKNKIAIVGGSSKGMGRAIATKMAAEGASVVICSRNSQDLETVASEMKDEFGSDRVYPIKADLSLEKDIDKLVNKVLEHWGRIDILTINLGGPPPGQPTEFSDEDWANAFNLSFYSAVRLSRNVLPLMKKHGWGRIISILSLSVKQPEDNLALSTVARPAVAAFMKTLSKEVAKDGITVNTVLPGSIETTRLKGVWEMQASFHGRDMSQARNDRIAMIPTGRFGTPEEVADLVCFLASENAGFLTGLHLPIDGGQHNTTI